MPLPDAGAGEPTLADLSRTTPGPLVLDFWAEWCSPCTAYGPVIDEVMVARSGQASLIRVNIVETPNLAAACGVSTIPAVVVVRDGAVRRRIFGARPAEQLGHELDRALAG